MLVIFIIAQCHYTGLKKGLGINNNYLKEEYGYVLFFCILNKFLIID